jgi:BioD-like phosphotransacetylase family protein
MKVVKMKKIVVASCHEESGKTSLIIGLAKALEEKNLSCGYMKPFGDRLLFRKKRLWDFDSALVVNTLGLKAVAEDITIGFDHSKLHFMYDEQSTKEKLVEVCNNVSQDKDIVFIEGGRDLAFGHSVYLDPLTLVRTLDAGLILILSGENNEIVDDITFLRNCLLSGDVNLIGVIINQVKDVEEFKELHIDTFKKLEVPILGIIPFEKTLRHFTLDYLYQTLLNAKIIAGEGGLSNVVHHVFVGAMSAAQVVTKPLWKLENKLIITPGDRIDMITAALDSSTAGIILTNNLLPDDPIIQSKADSRNIPILLVTQDTFATAKLIDDMEILFTKDEVEKIARLKELVTANLDISIFR